MKTPARFGTASLLVALAASDAQTQRAGARGVIDGIVTDTNLVALGDATVSILGSDVHVSTGSTGRFRITGLRSGNYVFTVHRIGYVPLAVAMGVAEGDTVRASFSLQRIVRALDTMIVAAKSLPMRLAEFEERRGQVQGGHFFTADEIEKVNAVYLGDVIRIAPSVGIAELRPGVQVAMSLRGATGSATLGGGCPFQLFLDGVPMPSPTNLASLPPPKDIAGVEIYSGPATIPLQYKLGSASCGVILIWTKAG